jgi:hypothetical protein
MSKKCLTRCVGFATGKQLAGKMSWNHLASEWLGGQMSRRLSSASTSACCLCFVSPLAIRAPGAVLGFVTISSPVAPSCVLASLVLVQPLGLLPSSIPSLILVRRGCPRASLFPARPSGLSLPPVLGRPVPVRTCGIGAVLGLITVCGLGKALASVVSGAGTALGLLTVSM